MINNEIVLKVSNLSKRIGKSSIIKDVSFELNKGEILGLLGPNGSGKTTILKMLVGLIKPTIGSIVIEKVNIRKDFEKAITHVGAIIENPVMYDFLSGYDNLVHFFRMTNQFSNGRIDEVIELLRMDDYIDDKVYTYSLGMRQRLGLAIAILHQPSILLLDEPTNGLDPEGIKSLRETLRKLANENGVSIIISSHILGEMELICDSVLVMDEGKCIERGLLSELQNGTSTKHLYSFKVLNAENIKPILQTKYENDRIHFQSNGFSIELEVEEVAKINKLLVTAGINVIGIERIGSPLEELYLQKLRGEET
ncbi:ABC transporter ATP-binding protein [Metabacillus sp. FJAT-53654]|uniref:ABC transporter ATP-binding protein n=1 Tax=Metabacillus rhizosphaerae TaxID=3117747 RepID=A0ABZ2MZL3_9BACI